MGKWIGGLGGVLGAAGTIIALILLTGDDWKRIGNAIFPWPLVITLTALLLGTWAYAAYRHFRLTPGPATGWIGVSEDQARLDRVLHQVPRRTVRDIDSEDFTASWPDELTWPLNGLVHEFDGPEHEFDSKRLETRRCELIEAARHLLVEEAGKSWDHARLDGRRNVGWSDMEISEDPEKLKTARARSEAIYGAAQEFTKNHAALIRTAKKEGLALNLDGDPPRPPWSDAGPVPLA